MTIKVDLPLTIRDLTVRNRKGRALLHVPSLTLNPGETLGVQGPSGAGKSTFLFALAGLSERASGSLQWGDTDLIPQSSGQRAAFRAAHMGIVFQDFLLFDELSGLENAAVSALFHPRKTRAAIRAQAGDLLARLNVPMESRTTDSLSGGERQRVAVARAMAARPSILLADEPTANLHREAADALARDMLNTAQQSGQTLVVVSHDPALLVQMSRVITIKDGVIHD